MRKNKEPAGMRAPGLLSLIAVVSHCVAGTAYAQPVLPTGPHAMSGIAGIGTVGSTMTVTTNVSRSMVNWHTFSIGSGAAVNIQQPGASSAILNRVVGSGGPIDPSVIHGALRSNGQVFLLNPSGIVFGATAQIDVAGLVASSLNLSNADFLGGRLNFTAVPGAGAVVNQGTINVAAGGQVYLIGPAVANSGIITSPQGEVILAAGNSVELVNPGTPNLRVEIAAPANEAMNLGQIIAKSGRIGIYAGLVKSSGTLNADRAVMGPAGEILLKATKSIVLDGTFSAEGGAITATVDSIGDASITIGGNGPVTIGGNGPTPPTIVRGEVTISPLPPLRNPSGPSGVINWQSFVIEESEQTNFLSGNISTAVLNRVGGAATTLATGRISVAGGISVSAGIIVREGGITLVDRKNTQVALTADQLRAVTFSNLTPGTGSILVNGGTVTLVGSNGQITLTADQVGTVTINGVTVPFSMLYGLGPLTLQRTTNLLTLLPVGQAVNQGAAQITGNMSTISQVNNATKNVGGAGTHTLTPPRINIRFE